MVNMMRTQSETQDLLVKILEENGVKVSEDKDSDGILFNCEIYGFRFEQTGFDISNLALSNESQVLEYVKSEIKHATKTTMQYSTTDESEF